MIIKKTELLSAYYQFNYKDTTDCSIGEQEFMLIRYELDV